RAARCCPTSRPPLGSAYASLRRAQYFWIPHNMHDFTPGTRLAARLGLDWGPVAARLDRRARRSIRANSPLGPASRDRSTPTAMTGLFTRRGDEACEQRVRFERARFEFRMKLDADEPGMILAFDNFRQHAVGAHAAEFQSRRLKFFAIFGVHFVAVAMALGDH